MKLSFERLRFFFVETLSSVASDVRAHAIHWVSYAIAFARWTLFPDKVIVAHFRDRDGSGALHPWGAKWRMSNGRLVCPHCNSMHPFEWLAIANGVNRWVPRQAAEEVALLIERGDLDDNGINRSRPWIIPLGSGRFMYFDEEQSNDGRARLVVETTTAYYSMVVEHLGDLSPEDFDVFSEWFDEHMPEVSIHRPITPLLGVCLHLDMSNSPEIVSGVHNHPSQEENP